MAKNSFPHIFIKKSPETKKYTSPGSRGGESKIPRRNRNKHGSFLKEEFNKLWENAEKIKGN